MLDSLVNVATILGIVIALLVLIELLALPDWIGRKLRGQMGQAELENKIRAIESRLADLEKRLSQK